MTIEYINDTPVPLAVDLLVSDDPNISQAELLATGAFFPDTVGANEVLQFDFDCVDARAIIIDVAELLIEQPPAVGTVILYQGLDFFCGEVVSFQFTTNPGITVLDVDVAFFDQ